MKTNAVGTGAADVASSARHDADSARKQDIFRAAVCVALERGFGKVTLDAVAQRAGVSKGGLLHHFATKADLIHELLQHYRTPDLIREKAGRSSADGTDPLAVAALIAAAEDPALLRPIAALLIPRRHKSERLSPSPDARTLARCLADRVSFNVPRKGGRKQASDH